jgi:signal transduction histidine kinase/ActR/RegA family two-component response regulator
MVLFVLVCGLISWLAGRVREDRRCLEVAALERERLLAAEQAAREAAERANRAKDDFLAAATHELRNPLSAIVGWVQHLKRKSLPPEEVETAVESIERSANVQTQLIADLLDLSRVRMGKLRLEMKTVNLSDVVRSALNIAQPTAKEEIRWDTEIGNTVGPVLADSDRLHQIVWNLLSNAIKFTAPGGTVKVSVKDEGDHAELVVADTGEGIDKEFLPKVFDRFQQEEKGVRRGGLGLGLAITKELVELHGGRVHAASKGKGCGAEFKVILPKLRVPAIADDGTNDVSVALSPLADALTGRRVLIVDDDAEARALIAKVLHWHGAHTIAVGSAREAEHVVKSRPIDVLISDLGMPEEDGIELIRNIRTPEFALEEHLPAIALTAYATNEDRLWALASGFQVHLGKPIEPKRLVEAVAELAHTQ